MGFGSLGETARGYAKSRKTVRIRTGAGQVEIPLNLTLSYESRKTLNRVGKNNVKNSLRIVAKYALEPARDDAQRLSQQGIGRKFATYRQGLRGVGDTYVRNNKRRKIRSYRAGVRKKGAYAMRARTDGSNVTLLFSVRRDADYYNFVANFWEHGWTANGTKVPGNQFMTHSVNKNLKKIAKRYQFAMARAVDQAGATREQRLRMSDLRKGGQ